VEIEVYVVNNVVMTSCTSF